MRKKPMSLAVAFSVLLGTGAAAAHHAFAPEFDVDKPIELKGTVTKIEWMNPHGWIYVDVADAGKVTNWAVETSGPTTLLRRGLRKSDFPVGAAVSVSGYLAKSGRPVVSATKVTFPDGRNFFAGAGESRGGAGH
jgi:hypothetical protein